MTNTGNDTYESQRVKDLEDKVIILQGEAESTAETVRELVDRVTALELIVANLQSAKAAQVRTPSPYDASYVPKGKSWQKRDRR